MPIALAGLVIGSWPIILVASASLIAAVGSAAWVTSSKSWK
jgi:hypothetical protein